MTEKEIQDAANQRAIDEIVEALNDADICNQDIVGIVSTAIQNAGYKLKY